MEVDAQQGKNNTSKGLVVLLCVLGVVIVGLGAGIGAILNNRSSGPVSMHAERFEEINDLAESMDLNDARALYEKVIEESGSDSEKAEARVEYGKYLLYNDEKQDAILEFGQVDENALDLGYKIIYFAGLRDYYGMAGDEAASEEYNEKVRTLIESSEYAEGG